MSPEVAPAQRQGLAPRPGDRRLIVAAWWRFVVVERRLEPQRQRSAAQGSDRRSVGAHRRRHRADRGGQQVLARPAGPARGLFAGADLCPRQRLPEGLVRRHRRAGEGGPAPRRDRGARPRPAAAAGQGGARLGAGGARPWPRSPRTRWQTLGGSNAVSKQTVDEKTGDLTVKQALTKAAQANVDRLVVLADFKRVTAPFDGIVTTRNTDVGALINAEFERGPRAVRDLRHQEARLTVSVPQNYVPAVKLNTKVADHRAGISRQDLSAASSRPRRARSMPHRARPACRSWSTTRAGELMPGAFANTRIQLPREHPGPLDPGRRADLRPEGPAGRHGRRQRQGRAQDHHDLARPRPGGRDRHRPGARRPRDRQPARRPVEWRPGPRRGICATRSEGVGR